MKINWYQVGVYAFTAIRAEMSVLQLQAISDILDSDTPVSGNSLAQVKKWKKALRSVEESAKLNSSAKQGDQNEHHLEDH